MDFYVPDYIDVNRFIAGVLAIGFIFGADMAETFRGGTGGGTWAIRSGLTRMGCRHGKFVPGDLSSDSAPSCIAGFWYKSSVLL